MLTFYKKAILMFSGMAALSLALVLLCLNQVHVRDGLLPAPKSVIPWKLDAITDVEKGGTSSISVNDSDSSLDYDYVLTADVEYPHVTVLVDFGESENAERLADLSGYSGAVLRIKCTPHNLLSLHLHSVDPLVTDWMNFSSYRITETLFSCHEEWSHIEIDLRHMTVPAWWLRAFGAELSDQGYLLDKVRGFSIGASRQGPVNTPAHVQISALSLRGRDWRYAWMYAGALVLGWTCFIFWLFRQYTRSLIKDIKDKLQKDRPLIAHQQLSTEPQQDREKTLLLRFIATEYADPDLSLEKTIAALGINRIKISGILKQELGLTFTTYLNKLRLTEAARLLSENANANVAEIAFTVGYNNVTYFNKLFKDEYGCSPTTFKSIRRRTPGDAADLPGA
jgi:AraC-like DNA-binding protein